MWLVEILLEGGLVILCALPVYFLYKKIKKVDDETAGQFLAAHGYWIGIVVLAIIYGLSLLLNGCSD